MAKHGGKWLAALLAGLMCLICVACGESNDPSVPEKPPQLYAAEGPFSVGELRLASDEEFPFWEVTYGDFPHIDGDGDLEELAEAFAQKQLNPDGALEGTFTRMNGFWGIERFLTRENAQEVIEYDFMQEIRFEDTPPNLLLLMNLDQEDRERLEGQGDELVYRKFATEKSGLVFVVPADFSADDLTADQARGILSGEITDWDALVGDPQPMILYYEGSKLGKGGLGLLQSFLDGDSLIDPVYEEHDIPNGVEPGGEGYTVQYDAPYANEPGNIGVLLYDAALELDGVKILSLDGVTPGPEAFATGAYPLLSGCYAVYRAEDAQGAPGRFADWLGESEGQALLEEHNLIPVQ